MSWSTSAVGKPAAVAAKIAADIARIKCIEPEEAIKNKLGEAIAAALAAFPPESAVSIEANGSQSSSSQPGIATNSFSVSVKPLYGFVE